MTKNAEEPRALRERVQELRRQVRQLETYGQQLFTQGNLNYTGEVAGKIRLLVCDFPSNEPLLQHVLDETGVQIPLSIKKPDAPRNSREEIEISLQEYMELFAVAVRTPTGEVVEFTRTKLLRALAAKSSSTREEPPMEEDIRAILDSGMNFKGLPAVVAALRAIYMAVLKVAKSFLEAVDRGDILIAE